MAVDAGGALAHGVDLLAGGQVLAHDHVQAAHDVGAARAVAVIAGQGLGDGVDVGRRLLGHDGAVDDGPHGIEGAGRAVALRAPDQGDALAQRTGLAIAARAGGGVEQFGVLQLGDGVGLQVGAHVDRAHGGHGERARRDAAHGAGHVERAGLDGGGTRVGGGDALAAADDVALLEQHIGDAAQAVLLHALQLVEFGRLQHAVGRELQPVVALAGVEAVVDLGLAHGVPFRRGG